MYSSDHPIDLSVLEHKGTDYSWHNNESPLPFGYPISSLLMTVLSLEGGRDQVHTLDTIQWASFLCLLREE